MPCSCQFTKTVGDGRHRGWVSVHAQLQHGCVSTATLVVSATIGQAIQNVTPEVAASQGPAITSTISVATTANPTRIMPVTGPVDTFIAAVRNVAG
jgi:hypothetical protein